MEIIITNDYDQISISAAEKIAEIVRNKHNCVIELSTVSNPIGIYKHLI